ncbi:L-ascorbate metabolism protein UlaG, beta-lactamase superfamily [Nocardioides psychrotolerans]|uniref:L-ascorbate metabolism protein UlaG, beta-lactamase superfamily n=2 Tax=Nocardioides psychrotolerans TaxID=1005945 RepID=A0A1I3I3H7_9ACTN|nr:L-ascorbate metabolism protein UlaG, beta-lactamase superfamily [Nocardioides psychrotolerans]
MRGLGSVPGMRITKLGHACVRIEHDGAVVVLDPGVFTEAEAVDGATAVLITHEHPDHYLPAHLRACDAPVFTVAAVAARIREDAPDLLERVTVVGPEERFDVGVPVRAVGELHAVIHPDYPRFSNSGYVLSLGDTSVYHPGDALTLPGQPVDLLLAPVSAPWLKMSEAVDFVRAVGAPRSLGIHDRVYSEAGLAMVQTHMGNLLPEVQEFLRLADGADL